MGGMNCGEVIVTVGCSPSKISATPPPSILVLASVLQVATPEDAGEVASKVKVTFSPFGITEPPPEALILIDVADRP